MDNLTIDLNVVSSGILKKSWILLVTVGGNSSLGEESKQPICLHSNTDLSARVHFTTNKQKVVFLEKCRGFSTVLLVQLADACC